MVCTTLAHVIDIAFLYEAYRRTRKDGATGVDGQTAEGYAANLEANLASLLTRLKTGTYHAPPVRRAYVPKDDGKQRRPIGIPTFEDKVLQRAVAMVLEAVYEQDFLPCSYGFRPGRSAHQALQALWEGVMPMRGGWVIDLDIERYFDTLDGHHLRRFLDHRVRDGVIRRTIDKWLKAGVMEDGRVTHPDTGVPQGSGVAPILANVYLHEVLDVWFEQVVKPRLTGAALLIRFADDAVMVCAQERDAQRLMAVLPQRFGQYGLRLHPEKTRLVPFQRPPWRATGPRHHHATWPGTFDFLGFTHYWGRSRRGNWVVQRKTATTRFSRALKRISVWCRQHRHAKVAWQHQHLVVKLRGHYTYYGITGNLEALRTFRREVTQRWRKWLQRRSQRHRLDWERYRRLLAHYPLPEAIIIVRTAAKT